jgi:glycosyltransferase involved in cell wall biosynthesis
MLGIKHVPELSSIYASSDFFITPSVTETLGQVVLEAMACGLPCVVTNKGGPTKLINVQSENGFVLEPQEDGLWLDAAQQLIASQELRQKMGMNSFESIKNFSIAATFESFWNIHQDIFSKHG